jgi:hypothetical protein
MEFCLQVQYVEFVAQNETITTSKQAAALPLVLDRYLSA